MTHFGQQILLNGSASSDSDGSIVCHWWVTGNELLSQTATYSSTSIPIGTHVARLTVMDDALDTHVIDSTAPVITLLGDNPQIIEKGTAYTELGANTDDGSSISSNSTTVDTNTVGSYTVSYNATDTAGNTATQVTRTVNVIDSTAPVITSSASVTVAENQTSAITLMATDDATVTYSISGGDTASFDVNASTGVVTFKVAPNFEIQDTYTFTATATDTYGNESTQDVTINISDVVEAQAPKKTGQTTTYYIKDDGDYQKGTTPSYTRDDVNNIVTDHVTNLQWADDANVSSVTKPWLTAANNVSPYTNTSGDTATTYCTNLALGGHNDWRLPSIEELLFITDKGRVNPAMHPVFENVSTNDYWSSTTYASSMGNAWLVYFYGGNEAINAKSNSGYVRCVRDGQ